MGEMHHWFEFNLNNSIELNNGGTWCSFWTMGCYSLWSWRNKEMHEDGFVRPSMLVLHVGRMNMEYRKAMSNNELIMD
jgi:hypothetical protein